MTQEVDNELHVRYMIDVHLDTKGEDQDVLAQRISSSLTMAVHDVDMLGQFDAEVKEKRLAISTMGPEAASLDEEMLTKWFSRQLEDGHMRLEDVPRLMARYALAEPMAMREEVAERIGCFEPMPGLQQRGG